MTWCREESLIEEIGVELIHVYPMFGREHDTDHGLDCWCWPTFDEKCPNVIVHNVEN